MRRKLAGQKRTEPPVDRADERRKLEVARKREGILDAAARAFARGGFHATTMQDIAREAGYTPPSLYAYFDGGKEQIFAELASLLSREFMAAFNEPMPPNLSFTERLEHLLGRLFAKADRYRDAVTVFMVARLSSEAMIGRGMTTDANQGAHFSSVDLLTNWLRQNAKRGELGDHRPEDLGVSLAGLAHAFCIQWLTSEPGTSIEAQTSRIVSLFLYGAMGPTRGADAPRPRRR